MNEREAKSLKIGDRIYYEVGESHPDNGDLGTVTDTSGTGVEVTYDDGLVLTYKSELCMSIHRAKEGA